MALVGFFLAIVLAVSGGSSSQHKAEHYEADIGGGVFLAKPSSLKGNHMALVCSFLRPSHSFDNAKAHLLSFICCSQGNYFQKLKQRNKP